MKFRTDGKLHQIDVTGTKVMLKSLSYGERHDLLRETASLLEVKDSKLINAGCLAQLIHSIDGREDVEAAINELETAADLLALITAIVDFSTIPETERKNFENSLSGKRTEATPTGSSRPTLSEEDAAAVTDASSARK